MFLVQFNARRLLSARKKKCMLCFVQNEHINKKASKWVGDSTETVFEANMLVVDEHNVICIAEHKQSFEKFKQLGITPHVVDFPPRHFWDGGIHCITVDIRRTGGCLDYFNE